MPPTIHDLLADPVFRMYYRRTPTIPDALSWGHPWMVWAVNHDGRWGRKYFTTYEEAWARTVVIIRQPDKFRDVAVVSRRVMFPPPAKSFWRSTLDWCSRCRRPSEFRLRTRDHHALRDQPALTDDEPYRCYYCGIRRAAMLEYVG